MTTRLKQKLRNAINKNMSTDSNFPVQANNSVRSSHFCIGFIDFMLAGKKLTDFKNLISSHDFEKNEEIILRYFKDE